MNDLFAWLAKHQDLAGWAQAVGAMIAIAIAIAVPAWQRHAQLKDIRNAALKAECAIAMLAYCLLADVSIWLQRIEKSDLAHRRALREDNVSADLMARLIQCEQRETNTERSVALFMSRRVVFAAQTILSFEAQNELPVHQPKFEEVARNIKIVELQKKHLNNLLALAEHRYSIACAPLWKRPVMRMLRREKVAEWSKPAPRAADLER